MNDSDALSLVQAMQELVHNTGRIADAMERFNEAALRKNWTYKDALAGIKDKEWETVYFDGPCDGGNEE